MIITFSEALIDKQNDEYTLGGCGFNFIRTAAKNEVSTLFLSPLSNDNYGKELLDQLIEDLVVFAPDFCNVNKKTAQAIIKKDNNKINYDFIIKDTCLETIKKDDLLKALELNEEITTVHNGALCLYIEPMATQVLETYKEIKKIYEDCYLTIDLNIREKAIKDKEKTINFLKNYYSIVDLVKASDEDLLYLGYNDPKLFIKENNIKALLYTENSKGSTYFSKDFTYYQEAVKVDKIVDSVGCGDIYFSVFLSSLDNKEKTNDLIIKAMEKASIAASYNLGFKGCVIKDDLCLN